jgi:hypothetical protein
VIHAAAAENLLTLRYRHSAASVHTDGRIPLAALTRQRPVLSGVRSSRIRTRLARHWTPGPPCQPRIDLALYGVVIRSLR